MTKRDIKQSVLDLIEGKKVTPKPKWAFLLRDGFFWSSSLLVIVLGSLAVATTFAIVATSDWDIIEQLDHTYLGFMFVSLPYVWIVLVALFFFLADYYIRHTKRGYTYSPAKLVGGIVGASVLLGFFLFHIGAGTVIDTGLAAHMESYERFGNRRTRNLIAPKQGILAGRLVEKSADEWEVEDAWHNEWDVDIARARIFGSEYIVTGHHVRIVGQRHESGNYIFIAEEIRPLRPPHGATLRLRSIRVQTQEQRMTTPRPERSQAERPAR
jgi:hypothetical protein